MLTISCPTYSKRISVGFIIRGEIVKNLPPIFKFYIKFSIFVLHMLNIRLKKGFGQVSNAVMRDPSLSLREKGLYGYMSTYASNIDNALTVGINRMAAECDVDESTIRRLLDKLMKHGVIAREKRCARQTTITVLIK
jgi:hypothetical protein